MVSTGYIETSVPANLRCLIFQIIEEARYNILCEKLNAVTERMMAVYHMFSIHRNGKVESKGK